MKYKIVLTERGKEIYKGGNIEVMKPILNISFEAMTPLKARGKFIKLITEKVGSASLDYYNFEKVRE
jgi:hypothetical protein